MDDRTTELVGIYVSISNYDVFIGSRSSTV